MEDNVKLAATALGSRDGSYTQAVVQQLPMAYAGGGLMPAPAPIQTAPADVSAIGAVANLPFIRPGQNIANAITFVLDNSAGGATVTYKMFDGYGLLSAVAGITATAAVYGNTAKTNAFNAQSIQNPYTFTGFNIQAAVSSASLAQPLNFFKLDATGPYSVLPINLGTAERNTSFNNQLQTFQIPGGFTGTGDVAITFAVAAGETITITWFVGGSNNRLF
jgi:hypothetical protein